MAQSYRYAALLAIVPVADRELFFRGAAPALITFS
jgi:hypothetical protein